MVLRKNIDLPTVQGQSPRDITNAVLAATLLVLVVGGLIGYVSARHLTGSTTRVSESFRRIGQLENLLLSLTGAETGQRGYLLTGDEEYLEPYRVAIQSVRQELGQLQREYVNSSAQLATLEELDAKIKLKLAELKETIELRSAGDTAAALRIVASNRGKSLMDDIRQRIAAMQSVERSGLKHNAIVVQHSYRHTMLAVLLPAAVGVALVAFVFHLSRRAAVIRAKAIEAIEGQRERLRVTLASIGDAVISTDTSGNVTFLNGVAESLTGWTNSKAAGVPLTVVFNIVNETTRAEVENPALRALRDGVIVGLANHTILIAKDGTERPIDDSAAPIRDTNSNISGAVLIFRDISERKREERQVAERHKLVALRADVSTALSKATEGSSSLQICCEALVKHLEVAFARIWLLPEGSSELELVASAGVYTHLDGPHCRVPVGEFKIGRIAASKKAHLTNFTYEDPNISDQAWARREGMIAFAGYPLLVEDRVVGVLAMFAKAPFSENVLEELAPIADGVAQYIDRKRSEDHVRESDARKTAMFATALDAIISINHRGEIIEFNTAAEQIFGYQHQAVIGKELATLIVPNDYRNAHRRGLAHYLATGEGPILNQRLELSAVRSDGMEFPIELAVTRVHVAGLPQFTAYLRDISPRIIAEQRLRESEEWATSIVESIDDGLIVVDDQWRITYINLRGKQIFASLYDQSTAVRGKLLRDIIPEFPGSVIETNCQLALSQKTVVRFDTHYDPLQRWFDIRACPSTHGLSIYFLDITQRKVSEERVREHEQRFRALIEQVRDYAIFMVDLDGRPTSWNEGVNRVLGFTESEFIGREILPLIFTREDYSTGAADRELNEAAATGSASDDRWMRRSDGTRFYAFGVTTALRNSAGKLLGFMKVMRDQTERKHMEDELRRIAADLSEADHRKDEFLATLAHELRNPLAPISNGLEVLKIWGKTAGQSVEQTRSMMERQLTQMVRLVDDLLDVSRITRNKLELRKERVDLSTVVMSAIETSRPVIDAGGHKLVTNLPLQPVFLHADLTRLAQVLSNLLNNAAKYTEQQGTITLSVHVQERNVQVSVKDTGVGIPREMLPRIFEMFTQVDRSLERSQGGLGIGLTLVRRLVEMHGGAVEAHSEGEGQGSEIVVTLPVAGDGKLTNVSEIQSCYSEHEIERKILVVDDNKDSADSLSLMLRMLGNKVEVTHDGEAALQATEVISPDLILLDIGLPKLNGYEVCRAIRRQQRAPRPVIVALTGWGQDEDRRKSLEAGFDHHLVKPLDMSALKSFLSSLPVAEKTK